MFSFSDVPKCSAIASRLWNNNIHFHSMISQPLWQVQSWKHNIGRFTLGDDSGMCFLNGRSLNMSEVIAGGYIPLRRTLSLLLILRNSDSKESNFFSFSVAQEIYLAFKNKPRHNSLGRKINQRNEFPSAGLKIRLSLWQIMSNVQQIHQPPKLRVWSGGKEGRMERGRGGRKCER